MTRSPIFASAVMLGITAGAVGQPPSLLPPPHRVPQLVIDHGGPHAPINALAFAPDGTLYVGGFGKVVHRYVRRQEKYVLVGELRVPIGPNNAGVVNAIAVSPDGKWVAVAGRAPVRGEVWSGADDGLVYQTVNLPETHRQDLGVVYLFNPDDPRGGKVLRGPETGVLSMTFAHSAPGTGPVLVTAGIEQAPGGKNLGTLRVFDVASGKQLASRRDLPTGFPRPGLAAWGGASLRVAAAWPADPRTDGSLLVWDVAANRDETYAEGKYNVALALTVDAKSGAPAAILASSIGMTGGQVVERPVGALARGRPIALGKAGQLHLPLAVAPVGADIAVLCLLPQAAGAPAVAPELSIVSAAGKTLGRVPLEGIGAALPTLAASRDGRTLAVAGFADDRIEVHDVRKVAASERVPQVISGAPRGYAHVAFLAGNRLWLGDRTETAPSGGTVLDFATRAASAGTGKDRIDGPPRGGAVPFEVAANPESKTAVVAIEVQGVKKQFALGEGERPTAAALLPAGPPWNPKLGAVVAIAHFHDESAKSLITLFDAANRRPWLELSGPTLQIEGLAFSNARPLLAAVGPDRIVSTWSLRGLTESFPAIEGVSLEERNGALVVASLAKDSPASRVLAVGDVVEAVGAEVAGMKLVRSQYDFLRAVRGIPIGKTARLARKGAPPVVVPVGRGLGHRHSLFDLWVNPVANANGTHDWIGWTPAGPYDTNSPQAESRLGWLTTTGDPSAPVVIAGADQYRRQYYKPSLLRFLAVEGDFGEAFKRYSAENPRTMPVLSVDAPGLEELDGRNVIRTRAPKLDIRLDDPERAIPLDRAVLQWRSVEPSGARGAWSEQSFTAGRATIELPQEQWRRGANGFEVAVRESPDLPVSLTSLPVLHFIPTAPAITARVKGEKVTPSTDLTTDKDEVEIAVEAEAVAGEKAEVSWTASTADGKAPRQVAAAPDGKLLPLRVRLNADAKTVIRLTARNVGSKHPLEATATEITVWRTAKPREVPRLRLSVVSAADPFAPLDKPHVSEAQKVRLSAAISAEKFEKLEWDDGDGKWVDAEFKPADPAKATATHEVSLPVGGKPFALRARVTAGGSTRVDRIDVVWAGLPEVTFEQMPPAVTNEKLIVRGTARPAASGVPFTAQVLVESAGALPRSFRVAVGPGHSWSSEVELKPGVNRIGLLIANDWTQDRIASNDVRSLRPPSILSVRPIVARGANVGDVAAVVVAPAGLPPERLVLGTRTLELKNDPVAPRLFGVVVWRLRVESVPLEFGGEVPKSLRLSARNAEGESAFVEVAVTPKPPEPPPPPPPEIALATTPDRTAIPSGATIRTDQPRYEFQLEIASAAKFVRIESRFFPEGARQATRVAGVTLEAVRPTPTGFALIATPQLALHEGVNLVEFEAATERGSAKFEFSVSYTPPPVRVTLESVEELVSRKAHPLRRGVPLEVTESLVQVRGRIVWTGAASAKRLGFEVVVVANEVRHPPVVLEAPEGKFDAEFTVPLGLNAHDVSVRIEVHRFGAAVAREHAADTELAIRTSRPLERQRLHVVVIAPDANEEKLRRAELAREVITAIGGEYPPSDPLGDRGQFKHPAFAGGATFYPPLVSGINPAHVRSRLVLVREHIDRLAREQGWVNDVVLVYYRGRDATDKSNGRLMFATSEEPIRIDELPATPGLRLLILNAVNPSGDIPQADPVRTGLHALRYVWRDPKDAEVLPELYRTAVHENRRVGEVVDWVGDQVKKRAVPKSEALLPTPVRDRTIGLRGLK